MPNFDRGVWNWFKQEDFPSKRSFIVWNMKHDRADRIVMRGVKRGTKHRIRMAIKNNMYV